MAGGMVCLDASLALKLLVVEDDSTRARALWRSWIARGIEVVAPGLFVFECVSALRHMVVRQDLDEGSARSGLHLLLAMPVSLRAPDGLAERAWDLARDLDRPAAYDCFYLGVAELLGSECWTADRRLWNAVRARKPWLRHLDEHDVPPEQR
jgi:predicted nucleic acid-binding protein